MMTSTDYIFMYIFIFFVLILFYSCLYSFFNIIINKKTKIHVRVVDNTTVPYELPSENANNFWIVSINNDSLKIGKSYHK